MCVCVCALCMCLCVSVCVMCVFVYCVCRCGVFVLCMRVCLYVRVCVYEYGFMQARRSSQLVHLQDVKHSTLGQLHRLHPPRVARAGAGCSMTIKHPTNIHTYAFSQISDVMFLCLGYRYGNRFISYEHKQHCLWHDTGWSSLV